MDALVLTTGRGRGGPHPVLGHGTFLLRRVEGDATAMEISLSVSGNVGRHATDTLLAKGWRKDPAGGLALRTPWPGEAALAERVVGDLGAAGRAAQAQQGRETLETRVAEALRRPPAPGSEEARTAPGHGRAWRGLAALASGFPIASTSRQYGVSQIQPWHGLDYGLDPYAFTTLWRAGALRPAAWTHLEGVELEVAKGQSVPDSPAVLRMLGKALWLPTGLGLDLAAGRLDAAAAGPLCTAAREVAWSAAFGPGGEPLPSPDGRDALEAFRESLRFEPGWKA